MDPVGYQRINKVTGKVIEDENAVKGIKHTAGKYVVLTDEEIRAAFPHSAQTVEIDSCVSSCARRAGPTIGFRYDSNGVRFFKALRVDHSPDLQLSRR